LGAHGVCFFLVPLLPENLRNIFLLVPVICDKSRAIISCESPQENGVTLVPTPAALAPIFSLPHLVRIRSVDGGGVIFPSPPMTYVYPSLAEKMPPSPSYIIEGLAHLDRLRTAHDCTLPQRPALVPKPPPFTTHALLCPLPHVALTFARFASMRGRVLLVLLLR